MLFVTAWLFIGCFQYDKQDLFIGSVPLLRSLASSDLLHP